MRLHLVVGACLLIALTACGGASHTSGGPALGPLPTVRSYDDINLPLDHYALSWHDRVVVETAREELTAACMAKLGYAGYPVDDLSAMAAQPRSGNSFGVVSIEDAQTYGFAPSWAAGLDRMGEKIAARFDGWGGPDVAEALTGGAATALNTRGGPAKAATAPSATGAEASNAIPAGGCREQGRRDLFALAGGEPDDQYWMSSLVGQAKSRADGDPRLKPVTAAFAQCVTAAGYNYALPSDAADDVRWTDHPPAERVVAAAVVGCVQSSRLVDTRVALTAAYQQQLVEANAERLRDAYALKQRVVAAVTSRGLGRIGGTPGGPPPSAGK